MTLRRALLVLALPVLVAAVPAVAQDSSGSTETRTVSRGCSAPADPHYTPPDANDCRKADGTFNPSGTYQSTFYSNDVRCGSKNQLTPSQANATGVRLYMAGGGGANAGYVSTCADGTGAAPNPVQGRVTFFAGQAEGATLTADGDKDNPEDTSRGWIKISQAAGASPPSYRCGKQYGQGGRADSDHPQAGDTSAECGAAVRTTRAARTVK